MHTHCEYLISLVLIDSEFMACVFCLSQGRTSPLPSSTVATSGSMTPPIPSSAHAASVFKPSAVDAPLPESVQVAVRIRPLIARERNDRDEGAVLQYWTIFCIAFPAK